MAVKRCVLYAIQEAVSDCKDMGCWSPIELKSESQKKLGLRGTRVPCGRCLGCLSKKRREWVFRLSQELKSASTASFLTLTIADLYDEETGEVFPPENLSKRDLQLYFKRVRKETPDLKYYAVGEYGSKTNRPHYHAIVFNADPEVLNDKWDDGITHQGTVTDQSISYVTKYLINEETSKNPVKPFAIMSKGLGKIYLKHAERFHKRNFTLHPPGGKDDKTVIPRYYRNKLFSKEENAILLQGIRNEVIPVSEGSKEAAIEIKRRVAKKHNFKKSSKSKNY